MSEAVTIGELARAGVLEFGDGYRTRKDELDDTGFRILRAADVRDGYAHFDGDDFVSVANAAKIGGKAAQEGDVDLTTKGTVGRVATVPPLHEPVVYSPQLCYFRIRATDVLDARFLRYWLRSPQFQQQSSYLQGNTDMAPYISLRDLASTRVALPPFEDQRNIGDLLSVLDDKIEANRKLAATADALVRSEFDSILASASQSVAVGDVIRNVRDTVQPSADQQEYVGLEHLPRRHMWLDCMPEPTEISSAKSRFARGDVLFGKLRPNFHKVVSAPFAGICSTEILVLRALEDDLVGYVLAACSSDRVLRDVTRATEGTRMPRTNWSQVSSVEVPWPGVNAARELSARIAAVRDAVEARLRENEHLSTLRDTLLPKLMSGQLRVEVAVELVSS